MKEERRLGSSAGARCVDGEHLTTAARRDCLYADSSASSSQVATSSNLHLGSRGVTTVTLDCNPQRSDAVRGVVDALRQLCLGITIP
ncbi:unnamed protein product [Sphagnum balticum]